MDRRCALAALAGMGLLLFASGSGRLTLFVNNLEDDLIFQNVLVGTRFLASPRFAWYGAPRTWGLRVGFRY